MHIMCAQNAQKHISVVRLDVTRKWATSIIHRNWFVVDVVMWHEQRYTQKSLSDYCCEY